MKNIYIPFIRVIVLVLVCALSVFTPLNVKAAPSPNQQACENGGNGSTNIYNFQVDGANATKLDRQFANNTVLRLTGFGQTRIDYWGTHKWPFGDPAPAPDDGTWPAPGANVYELVVEPIVTPGEGDLLDLDTGKRFIPSVAPTENTWLDVGSTSDCIRVEGNVRGLLFLINDKTSCRIRKAEIN